MVPYFEIFVDSFRSSFNEIKIGILIYKNGRIYKKDRLIVDYKCGDPEEIGVREARCKYSYLQNATFYNDSRSNLLKDEYCSRYDYRMIAADAISKNETYKFVRSGIYFHFVNDIATLCLIRNYKTYRVLRCYGHGEKNLKKIENKLSEMVTRYNLLIYCSNFRSREYINKLFPWAKILTSIL